ncbi:hypothetical protein CNMCM5878_009769 [Aspergillus fumigatiaffinis]|nr:hypothetical protein CNMCM5878_009769 [Aspergillus fumigatiaffinis]
MSKAPAPAPASGLAASFGAIMGFCRLFLRSETAISELAASLGQNTISATFWALLQHGGLSIRATMTGYESWYVSFVLAVLTSLRPIILEFERLANSEDPDKFTWSGFGGAELLRNRPASTESDLSTNYRLSMSDSQAAEGQDHDPDPYLIAEFHMISTPTINPRFQNNYCLVYYQSEFLLVKLRVGAAESSLSHSLRLLPSRWLQPLTGRGYLIDQQSGALAVVVRPPPASAALPLVHYCYRCLQAPAYRATAVLPACSGYSPSHLRQARGGIHHALQLQFERLNQRTDPSAVKDSRSYRRSPGALNKGGQLPDDHECWYTTSHRLVSRLPDQFEERAQPLYFTRNPRKLSQVDIIPQELPPYLPSQRWAGFLTAVDPASFNNARQHQIHAYIQKLARYTAITAGVVRSRSENQIRTILEVKRDS